MGREDTCEICVPFLLGKEPIRIRVCTHMYMCKMNYILQLGEL